MQCHSEPQASVVQCYSESQARGMQCHSEPQARNLGVRTAEIPRFARDDTAERCA